MITPTRTWNDDQHKIEFKAISKVKMEAFDLLGMKQRQRLLKVDKQLAIRWHYDMTFLTAGKKISCQCNYHHLEQNPSKL